MAKWSGYGKINLGEANSRFSWSKVSQTRRTGMATIIERIEVTPDIFTGNHI
jgi:hypothetical protein